MQGLDKDQLLQTNYQEEYAGHTIEREVASLSIANFSTSVQNVRKTTLKQNAEPKQPFGTKVSNPLLEQQNNNEIVTAIRPNVLKYFLKGYDTAMADYLVAGFTYGFELHYEGPRYFRSSKNLLSALQKPVIVNKKLQKELEAHRIVGPFVTLPFDNLQISPIGIVPKKRRWSVEAHTPFIIS